MIICMFRLAKWKHLTEKKNSYNSKIILKVCDKIFYYIKENNLNVLLSKKQKQFYESFNLNIGCC